MKPTVFIDTDIILDVLAKREPFYQAAAILLSHVERGELKACVSSLTFANLFCILRAELSAPEAMDTLKKLRHLVTVLPVDDKMVARALDGGFTDFEDALQYHAALGKGVTCLITRNVRDYRDPAITVCTAEEFLAGRA